MGITIDDLIRDCREAGASDLHLSVGVPPKYRVKGELRNMEYGVLGPEHTRLLIEPIMNERQKEVFQQEGEVDFSYAAEGLGRCRVNVFRQKGCYGLVIRLINTKIPSPKQLGIPDTMVQLTNRKRGMILVTGPTGSGKSTTLASLIDIINTQYAEHILTFEDPIEYLHKHKKSIVNQREVGEDTKTFASALRVALREDPDIILVGEMRDPETIAAAITAAETGHLVFSTLHTIGAAPTIDRIIDVFPPHQQKQIRTQLATILVSVISQQLVPKADGSGRVAAFEIMHANPAVRNLIREEKSHQIPSIIQTSRKEGMIMMDDSLYELYQRGEIAGQQALNFSQDLTAMQKKVRV